MSWMDWAGIDSGSYSNTPSTEMSLVGPEYSSFQDLTGIIPSTLDYGSDFVAPGALNTSWLDSLGLGDLSAKDWASLGLGGLSVLGNLYENRQNRAIQKGGLALQRQQLNDQKNADIAKTAALLNLIQNRQGIVTSPASYEAVAQGAPVSGLRNQIIDIGGKLGPRAVNAATGGHMGMPVEQGRQGALALLRGGSSGQADDVNANLSHGEYVMDADVVAALGDGNTEAGAAALDRMRENIRKHKRSASPKTIPPKARSPEQYLKGAK